MTDLKNVPPEIADRARVIVQMAANTDAINAADILTPWVKEDPEAFVRVMLAVALMADPHHVMRQAHNAYVRGDRSPMVIDYERQYQRMRKRKTRALSALRDEDEGNVA